MILFYSEFCPHCKMLLDTIKRHDVDNIVKIVSVESLKYAGKLPASVHSVPALLTPENKKIMFGKAVFDFLLLPGNGVLLKHQQKVKDVPANPSTTAPDGEPMAFALGSGLADTFSMYEGSSEQVSFDDRTYAWTDFNNNVGDSAQPPATDTPYQEETRGKITLPDIEYIKQKRDLELRGGEPLVNVANMPPATPTRIV